MIRLEALSLDIHDREILRDVSLDIAPGKVTGLVGESGSGKSMTALAIMGLLPRGSVVSGRALLDGGDLLATPEREMCRLRGNRIGMIFQEPMTALNPVKTIGAQVAETLVVHGKARRAEAWEVARERLARVGLPEERFALSRYPHELSGGQRQRVCIAMAVALHPELLIADEPTTALDVTTQAQILDLLNGLVDEEKMSLLLITHDLAVVAGTADHVAVMQGGRIVEQGPTEALFRTMAHPYTRKLFAASSHQPERMAQGEDAPLLEVRDAVREYRTAREGLLGRPGRFRAVDGVSFTLGRGESLGLVGESGCGKSTLTRAILGLDTLQAGAIRLGGQEIHAGPHLDPAIRRRMQVVFQDPYGSFNPRWTVERLVAEPFHLMDARPEDMQGRVAAALTDVGIEPEAMGRYIHEFSGGQRQRIAIARALITNPDLIVLDEAVSALDVRVRAQILDLLARLQAEHGMAYLFISHDLSVVRRVTDRVLVMRAGRIVEQGETDAVFAEPAHAYTRALIAATPRIPADWQGGRDA
ncbi:MAG: ABC transporter ATP-binding protein [Maritimibacter sp.]|nr:ABC transporter ATP-binding protein [Maritimibacter sp.]